MPENLKNSERYSNMEQAISYLEDCVSNLQNTYTDLQAVIEQ